MESKVEVFFFREAKLKLAPDLEVQNNIVEETVNYSNVSVKCGLT